MHRVSPLKVDTDRVVVVFSFAGQADRGTVPSHETMAEMYPEICSE
jgi:hypothetical protein